MTEKYLQDILATIPNRDLAYLIQELFRTQKLLNEEVTKLTHMVERLDKTLNQPVTSVTFIQ